ncbi:MAG: hypothetical protein LBD17_00945 [Endomicrobium sp.]|jgi:hypothetical protein|nr:hypothetical protein [Endomicrobium sp.]
MVTRKKIVAKKSIKKKNVKAISKKGDWVDKVFSDSYVVIDYPNEKEIISGIHYALRIGASSDGYAEISFNDGEWLPCRFSGGYWWFDWMDFIPGHYSVSARLVSHGGDVIVESSKRKCKVC